MIISEDRVEYAGQIGARQADIGEFVVGHHLHFAQYFLTLPPSGDGAEDAAEEPSCVLDALVNGRALHIFVGWANVGLLPQREGHLIPGDV